MAHKRWQWQVDGKNPQNQNAETHPNRRVNHGSFPGQAHDAVVVGNSPSQPKKLPQPPQSPRNELKSATSNLTLHRENMNNANNAEHDEDEDDAGSAKHAHSTHATSTHPSNLGTTADLAEILSSEELTAMEKFEKSFRDQTGLVGQLPGGPSGARNRKTIPVRPAKQSEHVVSFALPDTEEWVTFVADTDSHGKKVVKTACFAKIIEKMTANVPLVDMDDVLLCYHSFCLAGELLDALIVRYDSPSKEDEKAVRLR